MAKIKQGHFNTIFFKLARPQINYEFEEYGKPVCHSQRESHIAIQSIILRE